MHDGRRLFPATAPADTARLSRRPVEDHRGGAGGPARPWPGPGRSPAGAEPRRVAGPAGELTRPVDAAPDLVTAVIGFRQFRVAGDELWSTHASYLWEPGPQIARCLADARHAAPAKACSCGFYARYTPTPRTASLGTRDLVGGAVALWGRIELHAHGMRAEHAEVVALALPPSRGGKRLNVVAAARSLGIPAVPARQLATVAVRCGALIPRSMRPPDVMPNKRQAPGEPRSAVLNAVADGLRNQRR